MKDAGSTLGTSSLPRPLEALNSATAISAFHHSPLVRGFLPADMSSVYNEAAGAIQRLSHEKYEKLHAQLTAAPAGDSSHSTPVARKAVTYSDPLPQTPCPPRMAVSNRSRPVSVAGFAECVSFQEAAPVEEIGEESDGEDDALAIDLTELHGKSGSASLAATASTLPERVMECPAMKLVTQSVSTLAVHIQRSRPHEWNELIQVVLQGVMLQKSTQSDQAAADVW